MLLREGALKVFRRMAEEAESGSKDEALFSGLYRMASDLVDIIRKVDAHFDGAPSQATCSNTFRSRSAAWSSIAV